MPDPPFFYPLVRNNQEDWGVLYEKVSCHVPMESLIVYTGVISATALVIWALWAGSRILREDANPPGGTASELGRQRLIAGTRAVRFQDIRNREAERFSTVPADADYLYEEGYSVGWPDEWTEDLLLRRN